MRDKDVGIGREAAPEKSGQDMAVRAVGGAAAEGTGAGTDRAHGAGHGTALTTRESTVVVRTETTHAEAAGGKPETEGQAGIEPPGYGGRAAADESATAVTDPPVADPNSLELQFPDGVAVDESMLGNYRQFCVECGLTARQAQRAADFYLAEQARHMREERETALRALREGAWAGRFEERLARANHAAHMLDRRLEGRLGPLLAAGLGNNSVVAEMLALVGDAVSEDAFSAQPGAHTAAHRPMSTEEFLRTEVFNRK